MLQFILNDKDVTTDLPPGTLILDFIRYHKNLMGTKIGCREGDCGACTVLVGEIIEDEVRYRSATSCLMALGNAVGKHIVTIEGLNFRDLNPIQQAFKIEGASQCGFCTPGFIVSLAGFCISNKEATYENAIASIDGNICRCTGYKSIERATARVVDLFTSNKNKVDIQSAVEKEVIPHYFLNIKSRLKTMGSNGIYNISADSKKRLGGGTDLYVQQPEEMIHADINFLFDQASLKGIWQEGDKCFIGASATVTDILESPVFNSNIPGLKKFIKLVSSTQIRNMATVAGNFINASPIGDLTILFLSLDAQLVLSDGKSKREILLRNFYKGYKQLNKTPEEFIEKIWFKLPQKNTEINFEKVSKRTHLDIATVNTAMCIEVNDDVIISAGVSAGGVGPVPMFLSQASAFLSGKKLSLKMILDAIEIMQNEISPISDVRGSEKYKRLLLTQLFKAHFLELFPHLKAEELLLLK